MSDQDEVVQFENLEGRDLASEFAGVGHISFQISQKQAKRIKHDWDKFGKYKMAYAAGESQKGLWLSLSWLISNMTTSMLYGNLELITGLYYEFADRLQPVEFVESSRDDVIVNFRIR